MNELKKGVVNTRYNINISGFQDIYKRVNNHLYTYTCDPRLLNLLFPIKSQLELDGYINMEIK